MKNILILLAVVCTGICLCCCMVSGEISRMEEREEEEYGEIH